MRILIQPARLTVPVTKRNYRATITHPVVFKDHADLLGPELVERLTRLCPTGATPMWGNTPDTRDGAKRAALEAMRPGDWVFFSGQKRLYFGGTVVATWRNAALARRLWGDNSKGATWERMYALAGARGFEFPMAKVRAKINEDLNDPLRELTALNEENSKALDELLSLDPIPMSTVQPSQPNTGTYDSELERRAERLVRGEQDKLRDRLLPNPLAQCALCGRTLPREFLVAAHIKKRAVCTDDEKRDLDNIAMPACTFGCDSLYERGYITVDADGKVQVSPLAADVPDVADYINARLAGNTVLCWAETRSPYFEWHRDYTFKQRPPA